LSNLYSFSFIIPVVNEGNGINPLIEHLQKLAGDNKIELIVVDGDPLGSTVKEIKDGSVVQLISEKGRSTQMNRGAGLATGEVLIFSTLIQDCHQGPWTKSSLS
jgi:glycosyltransferase involved in cell wall biosynthesis